MEKNSRSSRLITTIGLKSIEVFKTDVEEEKEADKVSSILYSKFPLYDIHFDLEDCDRILRIEGHAISNEQIIALLWKCGYDCKALV